MTISAILGATTSGPTGSVYDQVWDYIQGVEYTNDCVGDFPKRKLATPPRTPPPNNPELALITAE